MHTRTHIFRSRVYTQWLLERETAMCVGVRELVRIRVRANRRFTQDTVDVLRGIHVYMCVCRASVCVPPVGGFTVGTESRGEGAQFSPFV